MQTSNYTFLHLKNYLYSKPVRGFSGCMVGYGFAFNSMEKDDEVVGIGNSYTTELRKYDPRLGRWFSIDPEQGHPRLVPWSPYHFGYNNPLTFIDTEGNLPWSAVLAFFTRVSSEMGLRKHPITKVFTGHAGMDIATPVGTPVNAMADGVIMKIGWNVKLKNGKVTGYGRYVVIKHKDGHYSLYAHLEKDGVKFKEGDPVLNGQEFAASGNTGGSTGPHLHLEVIKANSDAEIFNKNNKLNPRDVGDLQEYLNGGKKEFNLKDYYAQEIESTEKAITKLKEINTDGKLDKLIESNTQYLNGLKERAKDLETEIKKEGTSSN